MDSFQKQLKCQLIILKAFGGVKTRIRFLGCIMYEPFVFNDDSLVFSYEWTYIGLLLKIQNGILFNASICFSNISVLDFVNSSILGLLFQRSLKMKSNPNLTYLPNLWSELTRGILSLIAWAIIIRSLGSRWSSYKDG